MQELHPIIQRLFDKRGFDHKKIENFLSWDLKAIPELTSLKDLPSDKIFNDYLKQAILLNEKGIKAPAPPRNKINPPLIIPDEFKKALQKNIAAKMAFEEFSYSHKKEYVEYINEAKREETKLSRIEKSIEKLAEGKSHNWKYDTKKK